MRKLESNKVELLKVITKLCEDENTFLMSFSMRNEIKAKLNEDNEQWEHYELTGNKTIILNFHTSIDDK